jgi:hypothetical protein
MYRIDHYFSFRVRQSRRVEVGEYSTDTALDGQIGPMFRSRRGLHPARKSSQSTSFSFVMGSLSLKQPLQASKATRKPLRAFVETTLTLDEITQRLAQILKFCGVP